MARSGAGFESWPTGAKLLILLTLALLPLGLVLTWAATDALRDAGQSHIAQSEQQGQSAALAIESLVARNALALRIAANGALRDGGDPCAATAASLALTPAIASRFVLRGPGADVLCAHGSVEPFPEDYVVAPGDIRLWIGEGERTLIYRVGVIGGMATGTLTADEIAAGVRDIAGELARVSISDGRSTIHVMDRGATAPPGRTLARTHDIAGEQLRVVAVAPLIPTTRFEQLAILLPVLMWGVATLLSWLLVKRLLIGPLDRLKRAVLDYQPGSDRLELPSRLGPATEIRELGSAFQRAVDRIEHSELQMGEALEGQRRLVREVHHRVKNNLQVVASLLNIHGRNAGTPEASAAYSAIGRRVDALSVVHRNHFADVEESRGLALRPLLVELAATLRASAPAEARNLVIHADIDQVNTTQDAAVAVSFFVTEVVEFAMLCQAGAPVEIELRRVGELSARLTLASEALVGEGTDPCESERVQFRRVIDGLARQLRSPLDEKIGRLSVDVPVFPD